MEIFFLQRPEAKLFINRYSPYLQGDFVPSNENRVYSRYLQGEFVRSDKNFTPAKLSETAEDSSPTQISETAEDTGPSTISETVEDTSSSRTFKRIRDSSTSKLYKRISKSFHKVLPRGLSTSFSARALQKLRPPCIIASFKSLSKPAPPTPVSVTAIIPSDNSLVLPLEEEPQGKFRTLDPCEDGSIVMDDEASDDPPTRYNKYLCQECLTILPLRSFWSVPLGNIVWEACCFCLENSRGGTENLFRRMEVPDYGSPVLAEQSPD